MTLKCTTHIPNHLIDHLLPHLSLAEIRLTLIIVRQTAGWVDRATGKRKVRDRITHSQFQSKSGLSRQSVSRTLATLSNKGIITISDYHGRPLYTPQSRKGKTHLFYALGLIQDVNLDNTTCKVSTPEDVKLLVHNKTNSTKEEKTKGFRSIGALLKRWRGK